MANIHFQGLFFCSAMFTTNKYSFFLCQVTSVQVFRISSQTTFYGLIRHGSQQLTGVSTELSLRNVTADPLDPKHPPGHHSVCEWPFASSWCHNPYVWIAFVLLNPTNKQKVPWHIISYTNQLEETPIENVCASKKTSVVLSKRDSDSNHSFNWAFY